MKPKFLVAIAIFAICIGFKVAILAPAPAALYGIRMFQVGGLALGVHSPERGPNIFIMRLGGRDTWVLYRFSPVRAAIAGLVLSTTVALFSYFTRRSVLVSSTS